MFRCRSTRSRRPGLAIKCIQCSSAGRLDSRMVPSLLRRSMNGRCVLWVKTVAVGVKLSMGIVRRTNHREKCKVLAQQNHQSCDPLQGMFMRCVLHANEVHNLLKCGA